ncbi:MAG: hypothetical protein BGO29_10770 [Bacteroidales bacterium 36-12]|nr:MAG: hypothetical protein BGO29_10770 [Bacteroidales bacterium 36-12]
MSYPIITCASYGNTGSGVITDYLLEFDNIYNPGDYEFRFLQDYDGVSTLEDALVHNFHRMNSDIAIRNFKRYIDFQSGNLISKRYEKFFKGDFKRISYNYIDKLVDLRWQGYWEQYQIITPKTESILKYKLLPRILRLLNGNKEYIAKYVPKSEMYFSSPSEEKFITITNEYIVSLCNALNKDGIKKTIFLDQLVPPLNLQRYLRYYPNMKVIVVDRDPRDHYVDNIMKWREGWIPLDINKYIEYFRGLRKNIEDEPDDHRVLRIRFEDAIYNYDAFTTKTNSFLEISKQDHVNPKKFFNPELSINNTQLWKKYVVNMDEIHLIEEELSAFCYKFE